MKPLWASPKVHAGHASVLTKVQTQKTYWESGNNFPYQKLKGRRLGQTRAQETYRLAHCCSSRKNIPESAWWWYHGRLVSRPQDQSGWRSRKAEPRTRYAPSLPRKEKWRNTEVAQPLWLPAAVLLAAESVFEPFLRYSAKTAFYPSDRRFPALQKRTADTFFFEIFQGKKRAPLLPRRLRSRNATRNSFERVF